MRRIEDRNPHIKQWRYGYFGEGTGIPTALKGSFAYTQTPRQMQTQYRRKHLAGRHTHTHLLALLRARTVAAFARQAVRCQCSLGQIIVHDALDRLLTDAIPIRACKQACDVNNGFHIDSTGQNMRFTDDTASERWSWYNTD